MRGSRPWRGEEGERKKKGRKKKGGGGRRKGPCLTLFLYRFTEKGGKEKGKRKKEKKRRLLSRPYLSSSRHSKKLKKEGEKKKKGGERGITFCYSFKSQLRGSETRKKGEGGGRKGSFLIFLAEANKKGKKKKKGGKARLSFPFYIYNSTIAKVGEGGERRGERMGKEVAPLFHFFPRFEQEWGKREKEKGKRREGGEWYLPFRLSFYELNYAKLWRLFVRPNEGGEREGKGGGKRSRCLFFFLIRRC